MSKTILLRTVYIVVGMDLLALQWQQYTFPTVCTQVVFQNCLPCTLFADFCGK
jgi:hypothetical protein